MGDASGGGDDTWVDIPADQCITRYAIENGHEAHFRHGKIQIDGIWVEKSFLYFETKGEAEDVRENLSKLKGDSFLKSCLIISHKEYYWLAVDKFDCSLERYCDTNRERWEQSPVLEPNQEKDTRYQLKPTYQQIVRYQLKPTYQQIVRDIITGIYQLHRQEYWHGNLSIRDILIVNHRAKFAFVRGARLTDGRGKDSENLDKRGDDFVTLREVFKRVLAIANPRQDNMPRAELKHFHNNAARDINNWQSLAKLFFHPLLMTPMQRFHLPLTMHTLVPYERQPGQWREKWTWHQRQRGAKWKENVRGGYKEILNYRKNNTQDKKEYADDAWGQFTFVRNTIVHINDPQGKKVGNATSSRGSDEGKSAEDVVRELSVMLPSPFTNVYDLFNVKALASTSVHMHQEKIQL